MKKNRYVQVVEDLTTLEELGFVEDGFKNWNYILSDTKHCYKAIVVSGDYVFLRERSKTANDKAKQLREDLITLWNWDIAKCIPAEKLRTFVEILKEGNVREKKSEQQA